MKGIMTIIATAIIRYMNPKLVKTVAMLKNSSPVRMKYAEENGIKTRTITKASFLPIFQIDDG